MIRLCHEYVQRSLGSASRDVEVRLLESDSACFMFELLTGLEGYLVKWWNLVRDSVDMAVSRLGNMHIPSVCVCICTYVCFSLCLIRHALLSNRVPCHLNHQSASTSDCVSAP